MQTWFGQSQHLVEPRAFMDQLCLHYEHAADAEPLKPLWHAAVFLVFALGSLLERDAGPEDQGLPGRKYYRCALRYIPSPVLLSRTGILGIEVMALSATFLQIADCKEEAYVSSGVAMRLAIAQGLHRRPHPGQYLQSERAHRTRLWWTVYMQDRRLAASTGNPFGIDDDAIDVEPPPDVPGFPPAAGMRVNLRIARTTGFIMSTIYGTRPSSSDRFSGKVQTILHDLEQIMHTMPKEYKLDFSKPPLHVSRLGATLNLMLFQAIVLTIRPIMLFLAKSRFRGRHDDRSSGTTHSLSRLASKCTVAASRSLEILKALADQKMIAKLSFGDQEASFSVAFVFILAAVIDIDAHIVDELQRACSIIQLLAAHGNRTAHKQLQEIKRMCANLSIPLAPVHEYGSLPTIPIPPSQNHVPPPPPTHPPPPPCDPSGPAESTYHTQPPLHPSHVPAAIKPQSPPSTAHHTETHAQAPVAAHHDHHDHPHTEPSEPTSYLTDDLFLAQEEHDIYSWYHDLDLRGDDSADWEALGRELL